MQFILDFLNAITTAISTAFNFMVDMVNDLVYFLGLIGKFVTEIPNYFSWLPPQILVLFISAITLLAVLRLIGRSE